VIPTAVCWRNYSTRILTEASVDNCDLGSSVEFILIYIYLTICKYWLIWNYHLQTSLQKLLYAYNFVFCVWDSCQNLMLRSEWTGICSSDKKKPKHLYYNALSNKYEVEWNVVKMNRSGECESEILHCLFFFTSVANLLNLCFRFEIKRSCLERNIILHNLCMCESDIVRLKFCRYGWDNLSWKFSVIKEYRVRIL
jgi:hypothetical protein